VRNQDRELIGAPPETTMCIMLPPPPASPGPQHYAHEIVVDHSSARGNFGSLDVVMMD